jgi:hypothetical protein
MLPFEKLNALTKALGGNGRHQHVASCWVGPSMYLAGIVVRRHVIAGLTNSSWRIGQVFPRINRNRSATLHGP